MRVFDAAKKLGAGLSIGVELNRLIKALCPKCSRKLRKTVRKHPGNPKKATDEMIGKLCDPCSAAYIEIAGRIVEAAPELKADAMFKEADRR